MIKLDKVTWICRHLTMNFNLQLRTGEKVAVLGPSGAGKSTLLNLISGFLPLCSGDLWLNGESHNQTPPAQRPVAVLFQNNNLFSHLSAAENISLGLHPGLRLNTAQRKQVIVVARQVGLEEGLMNRLPASLSGGQQQRVALARCLIRQQPVLLLDEPFSALDPALRAEILRLLNAVCEARKLTLLMVSHNLDDAMRLATRAVLVVDGRIYYDGPTLALVSGNVPEATILGVDRTVYEQK